MILASVHVRNFRSVSDELLKVDELTALVGANGVGKSTFLRALELFYNPTPRITADDFYAGDITGELVITVRYSSLSPDAATLFAPYTQADSLTVERVFVSGGGKVSAKYFGATLRHGPFAAIRDGLLVRDRGKTARAAYDGLRQRKEYAILPEWSTLPAVEPALALWEAGHPAECTRTRDDGQFFGFTSVANGYLGRFTRLLYIPAVRDASSDAEEGRGSVLTSLMDLVVRTAVATRPSLLRLKRRSQALYERALNPEKIPELTDLAEELTRTLSSLVPDATVELNWRPLPELDLPLPTADVKVVEEEYPSAVERTGHGLQRAFIITMLQHLAMAQAVERGPGAGTGDATASADEPNLILAIEEPELYQHPGRQRHFARTLAQLASGAVKGVAERTQVLYGTHSPLFVSIDRIHQVRLLRRVGDQKGLPKVTRVVSTTLEAVAEELWVADNSPTPKYTAQTLLPRLKTVMTPAMSEGFFANAVVLVEGEDDRAALLGAASFLGEDLERSGLAIIACGGKTCLDRPLVVFRRLGIPVYLLWDGDKGVRDATPGDNHRLLRLLGAPVDDWPATVADQFACFEVDLETTLRGELGQDLYDSILASCQQEFSIPKRKHAQKNPTVVARLIMIAHENGAHSATLEAIVARLQGLH